MRIFRTVAATALLICVLTNPARSQNSGLGGLVFSTIVQPQRWHVTDFAINNRESVLYGGGGNHADGLVLVTDSQSRKFLSFEDPVPGVPGNYFWGVRSISLNDRDEAVFADVYGPCGDWYHCEQSEGIFTYGGNGIRKVVSSGDFAPGTGGLVFWGFDRIWFNQRGMILFQCSPEAAFDGSSVLRLKVVLVAGSAFVISDPFPVLPDQHYRLSSELRHYLKRSVADTFPILLIRFALRSCIFCCSCLVFGTFCSQIVPRFRVT